eukprot:755861-Hanusia_phi.AAC.4
MDLLTVSSELGLVLLQLSDCCVHLLSSRSLYSSCAPAPAPLVSYDSPSDLYFIETRPPPVPRDPAITKMKNGVGGKELREVGYSLSCRDYLKLSDPPSKRVQPNDTCSKGR